MVKAFLRRPGGVDQYPDVTVQWKLHHKPELHGYDAESRVIKRIDLSGYDTAGLHALFASHFARSDVAPPHPFVITWRRLFGWGYGISTLEATMLFVCGGLVCALGIFAMCCMYTQSCDALSDC